MTMSDAQFYRAVATLLRILAEQEPDRRVAHLAAEAERRAEGVRQAVATLRRILAEQEAERRATEARQGVATAAPEGRERC